MTEFNNISSMQDLLYLSASFLLAIGISLFSVPIVVRVTHSLKLMDKPNKRSATEIPVPTLGGIAIFLSFLFSSILGLSGNELPELIYIVAAVILMFFLGLKDDILKLPAIKKFIAQIIAASIIIFLAKIRFTNLHGFLGIWDIGMVPGVILTFVAIIAIINAYNLIDGIDGLAAGLCLLAATVFGCWFFISGHFEYAVLAVSLAGSMAGFFYFNVYGKENKIFMGDTGSLVLGTIIAVLVIQFNEFNAVQTIPYAVASAPAVSFGILIYPLIDTIRVMAIRIFQFKSPFSADKNHLHHRLLALGFSHMKATYTIVAINVIFIISVFALQNLGIIKLLAFIAIVSAVLVVVPSYFIQRRHLINKTDTDQQLPKPGSSYHVLLNKGVSVKGAQRRYTSRAGILQTFLQKLNLW
jgi:UDP-GlcNAc:undecaprenyl-phosphate GlcNAc-1-phosphate transferase